MSRMARLTIQVIIVLVLLFVWEAAAQSGAFNVLFTSHPQRIFAALVEILSSPAFGSHAWASLSPFLLGMGLAIFAGVVGALLIAEVHWIALMFEPLVMGLYCTPRLALLPLLIIWMGIGRPSTITIVALGALFPILINTLAGVRERDPRMLAAAISFGASRLGCLINVTIPGCLPHLLTGLRLGLGRGLLGVIVAEMYVSAQGIGFLIRRSAASLDVASLMALVFITAVFGTLVTVAVRAAETLLLRWHRDELISV